MINGMYALINGAVIVDKIMTITQTTEPAVPTGKYRIWHDNTPATERRWLVLGTDGTVGGNTKVEIS